jgi:hypothetical protein
LLDGFWLADADLLREKNIAEWLADKQANRVNYRYEPTM